MTADFNKEELAGWLARPGIAAVYGLDETAQRRLLTYCERLVETNQHLNLTAITDTKGIAERHLLDSFSLLQLLDREAERQGAGFRWADIGTGGGIPGFVLKLARPELEVVLIDSTAKRLRFIGQVAEELQVTGMRLLHSRAEEAGRLPELRDNLHFATARAVAGLPVLLEYALPIIRTGGLFVAMKGQDDELDVSSRAIRLLGGQAEEPVRFVLPGTDFERTLVPVRKIKTTPEPYPRKAGQPQRKPL